MVLSGKIALITGANRGLGKAIAEKFASEGARTVQGGRKEAELAAVRDAIIAAGGKADYRVADVTDPKQVQEMVDSVVKEHGTIDILVNNAGISKEIKLMDIPTRSCSRNPSAGNSFWQPAATFSPRRPLPMALCFWHPICPRA